LLFLFLLRCPSPVTTTLSHTPDSKTLSLLLLLLLLSYYSLLFLQNSHKLVIISDKFTVSSWNLFFISFSTPVFSSFFFFSSISLSSYDTAAAAARMIRPEILALQSRNKRDNEEKHSQ
jgi:hypothetical protein